MAHLALDLSKASAGWALWHHSMSRPACGAWELGDEYSSPGIVFARLHMRMAAIEEEFGLESVAYEQPLYLDVWQPNANQAAHLLLVGLAAHVHSYCAAKRGPTPLGVNQRQWRKHFLGRIPRGTKSAAMKDMAIFRCRELGILPKSHDAAEAVGLLDYALCNLRIVPPWHLDTPLVSELA